MRVPPLSIFAYVCLSLSACAGGGVVADKDENSAEVTQSVLISGVDPENYDITVKAWEYADSLLSCMTLEQKAGQCVMPSILTSTDAATIDKMRRYMADLHVGGVVLLRGNLKSALTLAKLGASSSVPLFMAIDAEWGLGMRLEDAPLFPRNGDIAKDAGEQLLYDYGYEVARECRRIGVNMVLGPVVDVVENPDGVIGSRSFGGDPRLVADLGVAYACGVEAGGVISVAKHFPGHGSPFADSHLSLPVIERSLQMLDSIDLYPFRNYIDAGLSGVMVGHLAVPAIDPNSLPAAVSPVVIKTLLRNELGFRGLVITDALNMAGVRGFGAADALAAGADMVVGPADTSAEIAGIISEIKNGRWALQELDDRVRRILFYKYMINGVSASSPGFDGLRDDVRGGLADSISRRLRPLL